MSFARQKYILEFAFWSILIAILWAQIDAFSEPIAEFRFGADGWPRFVLIGIFTGALGQLVLGFFENHDSGDDSQEPPIAISRTQQILIFTIPLFYLFLMHRIGFFVATPLFIISYLAVMEVRQWRFLIGVTAAIYGFMVLLFVRIFYVALPVGIWPQFYDINNAIITFIRLPLW